MNGRVLLACLLQSLSDIVQDVIDMLQADGESDEVGCHARCQLLLSGELLVGRGGRMDRQRLGIPHIGEMGDKFEGVDEFSPCLCPSLDAKTKDGARSLGKVLPDTLFFRAGI